MDWVVLVSISFIMGLATAIPIGATQIETAKRSISGNIQSAFMLILGAVLSDLLYGFIALFGIAPFFQDRYVEAFSWFIGAIIMIVLGIFTIIYGNKTNQNDNKPLLFGKKASFIVGFSIDMANPSMILWWLFCFEFLKSVGIVFSLTPSVKIVFIISESAGIGAYLALLSVFLRKIKSFFVKKYENKINRTLGVLLIIFSLYFVFKAISIGCIK